MKFLRAVIFFMVLTYGKVSIAQITCDFDSIYTGPKCAPYVIIDTAHNTSPFSIIERRWELTDPTPVFTVNNGGLNPTFSYIVTASGHYCLRLWTKNSNGDTCSVTKCIDVATPPSGNFTFSPTEGCAPLNVSATCNYSPGCGTITSLQIDWGCGAISSFNSCPSTPVTHTYTCTPGYYSPIVIVRNSCGCVANDTGYRNLIRIIPQVTACFTADTTTANCSSGPLTVNFTACNNIGNNISYNWYVNNAPQPGTSRFFTYVFPINNADCYDIKLIVSHPSGCTDTLIMPDYICNRSVPVVCFTSSADSACLPYTLNLTNCTPGLTNLTFTVTGPCGPYTPVTGPTASYNLTCPGIYTITATGTFAPGCTATSSKTVLMKASPVADFTVSNSFGCQTPTCVRYTANPPCAGCTYTWSSSGGTPAFISGPVSDTVVCYNSYGFFSMRLVVAAPNGCTALIAKLNTVHVQRINPVIGRNRVAGCSPVCATFTDATNYTSIPDPVSSVCWSFPGSVIPGSCVNPLTQCFTTPGCYNVKMTVTTVGGCVDTARINNAICVGAPPVCTVTPNVTTLCFEQFPVVFSSNCVDTGVYFFCVWGDGDSGVVYTPVFEHAYQDTGNLLTCIYPMHDSCRAAPICYNIRVNPPIAKFTSTSSCQTGNTVFLVNQSGGADSYNWLFCDGTTSTLANPSIVLPPCTTCSVTLQAHNSVNGCTHQKTVIINTACGAASVSPDSANVCASRIVATVQVPFTNTSFSISTPDSTRWDYDTIQAPSGPRFNQTGHSVAPFYNAPGRYVIAMENTSASGCKDTVYANLKICKPIADFTNNQACFPDSICFTNTTQDQLCNIVYRRWAFGDGTTDSISTNPCHGYAAPGQYSVKLFVMNDMGCMDSITKTVVVSDSVNLNYMVDTLMCPGTTHCMTNNSTGILLTYQWNIPNAVPANGTTFTDAAPCYTINIAGDYWARVSISSNNLCTTNDSVLIHVCPPVASGTVSDTFFACPDLNHPVQFLSTSTCFDSILTWNFGDQGHSNLDIVSHFYGYPGSYPICLTVTTRDGCSSTNCIATIVVQGPYGIFTVLDSPGICACKDTVHFTISTVNANSLILLYGCSQGTCQNSNIFPIGTPTNPTVISCAWPYCLLDSCTPQLIFGDTLGCLVFDTKPPIFIDSPIVNFTFNNYGACVDGRVCFFDSTSYHLPSNRSFTVSWLWDFGDGTTDNVANPCHVYSSPGTYNVRLTIHSNLGCVDSTITKTVFIPVFPVAGFYADDSFVCVNTPICFHDTSTTDPLTAIAYETWNFGDGPIDTSYTHDICHTYTAGGYYTVTLCVYDSLGCPDCDSSVIHVIDKPVADAGADATVCYGAIVNLNGTGGVTCQWSPPALVSDPNSCSPTTQLYNDTTFTLIVTDQYQCKDTDAVALSVARVFAGFNAGNIFCTNDSVCVLDTSSNYNGTLGSWSYDFGNGVSVLGQNVCFKYAATGNYTIIQIVTDNNGCADTASTAITIHLSPSAVFTTNAPVICSNQSLCVTDASTGSTPLTWSWNYGTGQTTATGQNPPCHTYTPPYLASYSVVLTITDQNGCKDTASHLVKVNEAPDANFAWNISCENVPMILSSNSVAGDTALNGCEWTFWLGAPSPVIDNNCSTSFVFPTGFHDVQLIVTDLNGCSDTIVKTVQTDKSTNVSVNPGDTTVCLGTTLDYTVTGLFNSVCWTPHVWLSDSTCSLNAANQTITPLGNVSYIVSAVNGACAPSLDTVTIHVIQPIPIEVSAAPDHIILGLSSNITSQIPGQIDSIVWTPDSTLDCRDCPNPVATPHQTTTYTATIYYSQNGVTCTNMASVTITFLNSCDEIPPYLPNTFTPNGDGTNDIFMIRGIAGKKINYFRIFDRWGKLVFESTNGEFNDPRWGWDGTDRNGKKLNPAVFVYTYEIECANRDTKTGKGNVSLVR